MEQKECEHDCGNSVHCRRVILSVESEMTGVFANNAIRITETCNRCHKVMSTEDIPYEEDKNVSQNPITDGDFKLAKVPAVYEKKKNTKKRASEISASELEDASPTNAKRACYIARPEVYTDLWTPSIRPKPSTGKVLVSYINQSTSMLRTLPLTQYLIPVEYISDAQWDMFTAIDQFYYDPHSELEEDFNAHDQKRIVNSFCSKKGRETIVVLSKFDQYKLPHGSVALLDGVNNVTAIIQTGVISE